MNSSLLKLEQISKNFPGVKALSDMSLSLDSGEILALLGENGAGKSTLMKVLCGIYQPDSGHIYIDGKPMVFANYHNAIEAGIGIIFQEFSLIPYLNSVENIFLGREVTNRLGLMRTVEMRKEAEALFERLGVSIDLDKPVAHLSVAEQQFVEIAKALALDARILVLDEPTATLTPSEAEHLFKIMRELKSQGVGMIFISHHMEEIFAICDRIVVLRDGQPIGEADTQKTSVDELVEMMVGRKVESSFPAKNDHKEDHEIVIHAKAIQLEKDTPINQFELRKGEILGFAGLVGSGRTELAMGLIGATPVHHKEIEMHGVAVKLDSPAASLLAGIGILPESRKTEGLILPFSIRENISINNLAKHTSKIGWIDQRDEADNITALIEKVRVKAPGAESIVGNLSGGNQQKVVIARWLNHDCRVLIFDEPTRGIDVGAKAEIYRLMRGLTEMGVSIIMISSELPEVVGISDRVAVFKQGEIVQTLSGADVNSNEIMRYATGGASHE
ncbi:Ribose import ATP-binding protein RbsA [Marinomonas gallaica]|uniref:Ribose import ATP-binding protein RbsA n=1 Tax=Marinomonas gallaica TaxID=1806667 RepID=A0A1C3JU88_9GAMM|nr:sugar ABC transporter ATP-binding protein [Marinomonas gallaica]SBT18665.1 Ribose import ATP-binding protein RbsA [Marinomonas gallaica]SBT21620.1 Ribose import ATP-binding protein RbsA [Marinomonas gallaica]